MGWWDLLDIAIVSFIFYEFLKLLHLIGASVLLGTGAGIAFFMLMAHRTRNVTVIAHTAHIVVLADYLFTASAVVLQPVTGMLLAHIAGYRLTFLEGLRSR